MNGTDGVSDNTDGDTIAPGRVASGSGPLARAPPSASFVALHGCEAALAAAPASVASAMLGRVVPTRDGARDAVTAPPWFLMVASGAAASRPDTDRSSVTTGVMTAPDRNDVWARTGRRDAAALGAVVERNLRAGEGEREVRD